MSVMTAEQFVQKVDDDLAWRKKELHHFRSEVQRNRVNANSDSAIRAGIAMLYAHWEGFVKSAGTEYVKFVATRRLRTDQLADNFVMLAVVRKLRGLYSQNEYCRWATIVDFLLHHTDERPKIDWRTIVDTKSNLNFEVLSEITNALGIDIGPYETKRALINERLVGQRNSIAHGNYCTSSEDAYHELHTAVVSLLDLFRLQIQNKAMLKEYLEAGARQVAIAAEAAGH